MCAYVLKETYLRVSVAILFIISKKLEKAQVPINKKDKLSYISAMEFYAMMKMSEPHQTITRMILTNKSIEIVRSRKIYVSLIYTKFLKK